MLYSCIRASLSLILAKPSEKADFAICIDETCPQLIKEGTEGVPLFQESGELSPFLERAKDFLTHFQSEVILTERFIKRLQSLNLLSKRVLSLKLSKDADPLKLGGFETIDNQALDAIGEADILSLFKSHGLMAIYSHVTSMRCIPFLARTLRQEAESASATGGKKASAKTVH